MRVSATNVAETRKKEETAAHMGSREEEGDGVECIGDACQRRGNDRRSHQLSGAIKAKPVPYMDRQMGRSLHPSHDGEPTNEERLQLYGQL